MSKMNSVLKFIADCDDEQLNKLDAMFLKQKADKKAKEKITMSREELQSYIDKKVQENQKTETAKKEQFADLLGKKAEPPKPISTAEITAYLKG